jgi:plasmid maintenance system antidote protein VapI
MDQTKFFRALRHMNLRAVSEASGVHRNTLYAFMAGRSKLSPETIEKLRVYLEARGVVISG